MVVGLGMEGTDAVGSATPPREQTPSPGFPTLLPRDWASRSQEHPGSCGVSGNLGLLVWDPAFCSALAFAVKEDVTIGDPSLVPRNSQT